MNCPTGIFDIVRIFDIVHKSFNNIYKGGDIPEAWKHSTISLLEKNSNTNLPEMYRPIALLDTLYKIYTSILNNKLKRFIKDNNIMAKAIYKLYDNTIAVINTPHGLSDEFMTTRGLRQGDSMSPQLFNISINPIINIIHHKYMGYKLHNGSRVNILAFMDDILLISSDLNELNYMVNDLNDFLEEIGMMLNGGKTSLISNCAEPCSVSIKQKGKEVLINEVKESKFFKYLGIWISLDMDWSKNKSELSKKVFSKLTIL